MLCRCTLQLKSVTKVKFIVNLNSPVVCEEKAVGSLYHINRMRIHVFICFHFLIANLTNMYISEVGGGGGLKYAMLSMFIVPQFQLVWIEIYQHYWLTPFSPIFSPTILVVSVANRLYQSTNSAKHLSRYISFNLYRSVRERHVQDSLKIQVHLTLLL